MRPRVIVLQMEVFVAEVEQVFHVGIEHHTRQGARRTGELQPGLVQVVEVEMGVAGGVDEVAGL